MRVTKTTRWLLLVFLALETLCSAKMQNSFEAKIHRHKSANNRVLVDKFGNLSFDDSVHALTFTSESHDDFKVPYDSVAKVVFDASVHMRGGVWPAALAVAGAPGMLAGAAIAGGRVHDYWMFLEYRDGEKNERVLLELPKQSSKQVIDKSVSLFGPRVTVTDFHEKVEPVDPDKLPAIKSKDTVTVDKRNHPAPESKSDQATVVVVCPPLAARNAGRGNQFKLHANGRIIAVNKPGTYSFAYIDPGRYRLISQSQNANGFEMELKAGETYYFIENSLQGAFKYATLLSRNSPELVMYLVDGSYFSDWKPK